MRRARACAGGAAPPVPKPAPPSDHTPLRRRVVRLEGRSHQTTPACWLQRGGAVGGGCALMRTLGRFPAAIVTGVDRIRCSVIQILGARKPPVWAWHHPDEER